MSSPYKAGLTLAPTSGPVGTVVSVSAVLGQDCRRNIATLQVCGVTVESVDTDQHGAAQFADVTIPAEGQVDGQCEFRVTCGAVVPESPSVSASFTVTA